MNTFSPSVGDGPGDRISVRERLDAERRDTEARIAALHGDFDAIVEANALVAVDDEHDPEGSSTAFERAHTASLLARARDHLAEVDRALERLERGDYGRCERCREPIPPGRLEVRPPHLEAESLVMVARLSSSAG
nr:TraR/DksA family transcriptional regulator [Streptomyces sp. FT05W]